MKRLSLFLVMALYSLQIFSQDFRIFHGSTGSTTIFRKGDNSENGSLKSVNRINKPKGSDIEIVILNPNPFFYNYEIKTEDFDIKDDTPDLSSLIGALNSIKDISSTATSEDQLKAGFILNNNFNKYKQKIQKLYKSIQQAREMIEASDNPGSKKEALDYSSNNGYRKAVDSINKLGSSEGEFNKSNLQKDLDDYLQKADEDETLYAGLDPTDQEYKNIKKLYKDAFTLLNKQLVDAINSIKQVIASNDDVLRFIVPVKEKGAKIKLVITKKESNRGSRIIGEIQIAELYPQYARPALELVPVANLTYASNIPSFGVENGVITSTKGDGFKFRVGTMLLYNFAKFGEYNEGSFGVGLGFNIPKKDVFESFYIGSLLSYKNIFRIGAGFGFSDYPFELKGGAKVGQPLPQNISKLEDVVEYKRKPTLFISLSIAGITLRK